MVKWPWSKGDNAEVDAPPQGAGGVEPVATCKCQDGTVTVYEDSVEIVRASRSRYADKTIELAAITGVEFSEGIAIGYIQLRQADVDHDEPGRLSSPVDENTLHFGRGSRDSARQVRDAILERLPAA